jgi:hypothetical protein
MRQDAIQYLIAANEGLSTDGLRCNDAFRAFTGEFTMDKPM